MLDRDAPPKNGQDNALALFRGASSVRDEAETARNMVKWR